MMVLEYLISLCLRKEFSASIKYTFFKDMKKAVLDLQNEGLDGIQLFNHHRSIFFIYRILNFYFISFK